MVTNVVSVMFFFKQKTAYEMRISDWSSDVCSSDLASPNAGTQQMRRYAKQIYNIVASHPEHDQVFQFTGINGLNTTLTGVILKPWEQRSKEDRKSVV